MGETTHTTRCTGQVWHASSRVKGWGNNYSCDNKANGEDGLCTTHRKLERRNALCCEKCGKPSVENGTFQFGGRTVYSSVNAWSWCDCGHCTRFGRDNLIEGRRAGLLEGVA